MRRRSSGPTVAAVVMLVLVGPAPSVAQQPRADSSGTILRIDPQFDRLVSAGARLETVAQGFSWVEGPVWHRAGGYLLVSDVAANAVYRWRPGQPVERLLEASGYTGATPFQGTEPGSNGLAFDGQGRLLLCQHGDRRIIRLEPDGRRTVLVDRYLGRRLNSPNDLTVASSGDLYFTDPPFGLPGGFDDAERDLEWQGVYRLERDGALVLLTKSVRAPNGVALSPDERTLYVANADRAYAVWYAFAVREDGSLDEGRVVFDATSWAKTYPGAPDGMKVDREGNLFAAGPGGVYVLAADGTHLGMIVTGVATSNVAWGGSGSDLYITAGSVIHRLRVATMESTW